MGRGSIRELRDHMESLIEKQLQARGYDAEASADALVALIAAGDQLAASVTTSDDGITVAAIVLDDRDPEERLRDLLHE